MNTLARNKPPDISILMTAFNTERYLPEAIESILQQNTDRSWELIFVDDGSTDKTLPIVRAAASRHPDLIRVFRHPFGVNRGISSSRNLALRHARGAALAFLDSDDVWLPHHLETQAALLDAMPLVGMVYAGAERWFDFTAPFNALTTRRGSWGENHLPALTPAGKCCGLLPRGELLNWFLRDESLVPCICTVMVRAEVARAVSGFCDTFRGLYDDQAFHAKVLLEHDVFANDICTARYRQHGASCCGQARQHSATEHHERRRFLDFLQSYSADKIRRGHSLASG